MSETTVPLRLPVHLKGKIVELARANRRSTTKEIQVAIERHVGIAPETPPGMPEIPSGGTV